MASEGGCVKEENALDYGKFQVKLAELLDRSTIRRLTFYFEFSLAERDKISNNEDPGLELLDQLEAKGLMSSRDVSKVICALKEIDRSGVAEKVERMLNVTQPSKQEPKHEKSDESHVGKTRKEIINKTVIVSIGRQTHQPKPRGKDQTPHQKYNGMYDVSDGTTETAFDLKVYGDLWKSDKSLFKEGNNVILRDIIVHKDRLVYATRSRIERYQGDIGDVTNADRLKYGAVSLLEIELLQETMDE